MTLSPSRSKAGLPAPAAADAVRSAAPAADLLSRFERLASERYHHRHPFHLLMHAGKLDRDDLRSWVANRYYYQTRIPINDALIVAKAEDQEFRQVWLQRLHEQDGRGDALLLGAEEAKADVARAGGLELWRRLGRALGVSEAELRSNELVLPGARSACDDYVELVRSADLVTAVASSLTDYFAGHLLRVRIEAWLRHYPYVPEEALACFRERVTRAPADAEYAFAYVKEHARTEAQKQRCLAAFEQKCAILWRLLDAVYIARRVGAKPRLEDKAWLMKVSLAAGAPDAPGQPGVLLVPEQALQLNRTGFELLERCDGHSTLGQIIVQLATEHVASTTVVERDIAGFVAELERRQVLVFEG